MCKFDDDQSYLSLGPETCEGNPGKLLEAEVTAALTIKAKASNQSKAKPDAKRYKNEVTFEFQTGAVLRELPFPESFGLIFVADQNGQVLYQDAPSTQTWLNQLRWESAGFTIPAPAAMRA